MDQLSENRWDRCVMGVFRRTKNPLHYDLSFILYFVFILIYWFLNIHFYLWIIINFIYILNLFVYKNYLFKIFQVIFALCLFSLDIFQTPVYYTCCPSFHIIPTFEKLKTNLRFVSNWCSLSSLIFILSYIIL